MTLPRFMQIHSLASYPAALINRDDSGMAKRLPFGDAIRTRRAARRFRLRCRVVLRPPRRRRAAPTTR